MRSHNLSQYKRRENNGAASSVTRATSSVVRAAPRKSRYGLRGVKGAAVLFAALLWPGSPERGPAGESIVSASSDLHFLQRLFQLPWEDPPPKFHAKILDQPSRSPSRKGIPGKYREVAQPAGGRGALYVAALEEKEKTRRHAQTEPGRAIPWELREEHAEGSRTHYLAGPGTHWINQQKFWRVKNKVGQRPVRMPPPN